MKHDWFELTTGPELQQGDIISNCPVIRPVVAGTDINPDNIPLDVNTVDLIVMTQSCDLVPGRGKVDDVMLCLVMPLDAARGDTSSPLAKKESVKQAFDFKLVSLHPLPACTLENFSRPYSIVLFKNVFTLPLEFLTGIATKNGKRARLRSPFKEHLAQRFGFMFSRVGLPETLTPPGTT